jgi:hypothetical protein
MVWLDMSTLTETVACAVEAIMKRPTNAGPANDMIARKNPAPIRMITSPR